MFLQRIRSLSLPSVAKRSLFCSINSQPTNNIGNSKNFSRTNYKSGSQSLDVKDEEEQKLWVNSKITDLQPCVGLTIPELIRSNVRGWENAVAFECAATGVKYTHGQVLNQSRGFAASLIKSNVGFKRGDIVAILAHNIPEYCTILFGIWEAGLVATPLNPAYTAYEIKHQLELSGAKAIVTLAEYLPTVVEVKAELPSIKSVIIVGEAQEGCHTFHEMTKTDTTGVEFSKGHEFNTLTETALLPYSSGTTGLPKGVMLTHSSLGTNILQYNHPLANVIQPYYADDDQARLVGVLPFFHSYAMNGVLLSTMWKGSHTMTLPRFRPNLFLEVLERHKPTDMHLVPPVISFMINNEAVTKDLLAETRTVIGGAAPVGPALINQLLEKAGRFILFQEGYGMTELSPVSHLLLPQTKNTKIGSCGSPLPLTMTKIVDVKTGKSLPRYAKGEICVKGPQVMTGYFNNEEATRNTIDPDGWLHTGDVGYYDMQDCLYIVDRLKELIKVKGYQVAPSELEDLLRSHAKVADVAVIGVPDKEWGELPRAYVVRKGNGDLSVGDLVAFVQDKVAAYKQLRGGIEFVQEIPKSAAGKILRKDLLADFKKNQNQTVG